MADERPPIPGEGGQEFEQAAKRVLQRATKVVSSAEAAAADAREASRAIQQRARTIARRMGIEQTEGGRFLVTQRERVAGQYTDVPAMRQGRSRPSYFATRGAAEQERAIIASQRASIEAREREATAVQRTEERKTTPER